MCACCLSSFDNFHYYRIFLMFMFHNYVHVCCFTSFDNFLYYSFFFYCLSVSYFCMYVCLFHFVWHFFFYCRSLFRHFLLGFYTVLYLTRIFSISPFYRCSYFFNFFVHLFYNCLWLSLSFVWYCLPCRLFRFLSLLRPLPRLLCNIIIEDFFGTPPFWRRILFSSFYVHLFYNCLFID